MSRLHEANAALRAAKEEHKAAAKEELGSVLSGIFESDPSIHHVVWGQKYSEYNDEGMYPGISGPVINSSLGIVDEENGELVEIDLDGWWNVCAYPGEDSDPQYQEQQDLLSTTLSEIGEDVLCEIVGEDEHVVVAQRSANGFDLWSEYAGY